MRQNETVFVFIYFVHFKFAILVGLFLEYWIMREHVHSHHIHIISKAKFKITYRSVILCYLCRKQLCELIAWNCVYAPLYH